MEWLREYQVNIMLSLSSICAIIAVFVAITRTITKSRKRALLMVEIGATIWLEADRLAYIYHGMPGVKGYWIVRVSNFLVFFMTIFCLYAVNKFLEDVITHEGGMPEIPTILRLADRLAGIAELLVIISQFTGLYYTFDEMNTYQRSPLYFISYIFPYSIIMIQFLVILRYRKRLHNRIALSIFLFDLVSLIASLIQLFIYGVSLVDMSAVVMVIGLYIFALLDMNEQVERANMTAISHLQDEQEAMKNLFEQTAVAIASAIDDTEICRKGHSVRVAEYAREIAARSGKDQKGCNEVYYAALLHDVGKLDVADIVLQKDTDYTNVEKELLDEHTVIGEKILSGIKEIPSLSLGAKYHHERYDGKGYPEGLKGEDIPDVARIIAVANAYDEMTSRRSYRDPLPQRTVREAFIEEGGTVFDPVYAEIMADMIDQDKDYLLKEKEEERINTEETDITKAGEMHFGEYKGLVSDGIAITTRVVRIRLKACPDKGADANTSIPAMILFDSHDGCVQRDDRGIRILSYLEYGEIWFDGHTVCTAAREIKVDTVDAEEETQIQRGSDENAQDIENKAYIEAIQTAYEIEALRYKDHVRIKIAGGGKLVDVTAALPDSARFSYIGFTGEHCSITDVQVEETDEIADESSIVRIAEEVSFVERMEGDIPNVQVDSNRSDTTKGMSVRDGMHLIFHTMSLPTASLVWHCAYLLLFRSDDGTVNGDNFREYACIRLDGEEATREEYLPADSTLPVRIPNELTVHRDGDFEGWDAWKELNKRGFDCEVNFRRRRNKVTMITRNAGILLQVTTTITDKADNLYVALTGDQCALTDIHVL